jgi:RNA polymerase sigma-70 factor (ECF subfamily)
VALGAGGENAVRRAAQGDWRAFEALVASYEEGVYEAAFRCAGDHEEAGELAQEALRRAYAGLENGAEDEAGFRTALYGQVFRLCRERLRGRRPRGPVEASEADSPLQAALNRLPPSWRLAVVASDVAGMEMGAAAAALGWSVEAARAFLACGRLAVRECMGGFGEEAHPGELPCDVTRALVYACPSAELLAGEAERLESHVAECERCRQAAEHAPLATAGERERVAVPAAFAQELAMRLLQEKAAHLRQGRGRRWLRPLLVVLAVTGVAAVALVSGLGADAGWSQAVRELVTQVQGALAR